MRLGTAVVCGVLCLTLNSKIEAVPEIIDELTYSVWQEKSLRKAPKRIILQHFNIWYRTTSEVRDGTLAMRSALATLEPELALQITDTACAYLIEQLKARGYEVTVLDSSEIVKHKKMKKALKKKNNEGAGLYNGSTAHVSQEAAGGDGAILSTAATGMNHFWLGPAVKWQEGMDVLKKASKGDAAMLAVSAFVDFTEPKSGYEAGGVARRSDYMGVSAAPAIRLFNDARWGAPNAGYGGGMVTFMHGDLEKNMMTVIDRDASWVVAHEDAEPTEGFTVRTLTIDPQKFRQAAEGVLKVFVDELIAKYEESFYGDS